MDMIDNHFIFGFQFLKIKLTTTISICVFLCLIIKGKKHIKEIARKQAYIVLLKRRTKNEIIIEPTYIFSSQCIFLLSNEYYSLKNINLQAK